MLSTLQALVESNEYHLLCPMKLAIVAVLKNTPPLEQVRDLHTTAKAVSFYKDAGFEDFAVNLLDMATQLDDTSSQLEYGELYEQFYKGSAKSFRRSTLKKVISALNAKKKQEGNSTDEDVLFNTPSTSGLTKKRHQEEDAPQKVRRISSDDSTPEDVLFRETNWEPAKSSLGYHIICDYKKAQWLFKSDQCTIASKYIEMKIFNTPEQLHNVSAAERWKHANFNAKCLIASAEAVDLVEKLRKQLLEDAHRYPGISIGPK